MKHLVPLYSREPVGVGTPLVESLTSFLGRLSTAQYMMPSAVCNELVRPLVPEDMKGKVFWREGLNGQNGVTWDGHSEITEVLVDALTKLTALPDLSLHTLLPWRQLLLDQKSGALRWGQRRWCASCLAGWRAKGVEPWEPLLWRVAVVRRCPVHCTPFSEVCPRCQVRQGYMPGMVRIGVCRKCGHHLETGDPLVCTGARAPLATPEERWEWEVSQVVGRMLAHQEEMAAHASPRGFLTLLERLLHRPEIGSKRKLVLYVGADDMSVRRWLTGKHLWRTELFIRVCMRAGVDPLAVAVYPHRDYSEVAGLEKPSQSQARWPVRRASSRKAPCRHWGEAGWKQFREKLSAILEDPTSGRLSLTQITKSLGVSHSTLKRRYPKEYAELKVLHGAYRKRNKDQRLAAIEALLEAACLECIREGVIPKQKLVFARAGLSPRFAFNYTHGPIWRKLWRKYGGSMVLVRRKSIV